MNFKRLYVWFGLPVAIVIVWLLAVYVPVSSSLKQRESRLANVKSERQALERNMQELVSEAGVQKRLQESYGRFMIETPTVDRIPQYLRSVADAAKARGVVVNNVNVHYDSVQVSRNPGLSSPVIAISLKGDFLDIGRFLEGLSRRSAYRNISDARIYSNDRDYPRVTGEFTVEYKALRGDVREGK